MKRLLPFFLLLCLTFGTVFAQNTSQRYARVQIDLTHTNIEAVARLGLETDHGEYVKGRYLVNDFSEREIALLSENNIFYKILIDDVKAHYCSDTQLHTHANTSRDPVPCTTDNNTSTSYDYETPEHYQDGTMSGYFRYTEMLTVLANMRALYPHLITAPAPIGDFVTHEGRPIYWLRISDNPEKNEPEPEVLYTALHHAREPNSLSQMLFYMWYLLENYGTDPEVTYLVNETEMYFVPCINPDGYILNETNDPNGGGLWRKNAWKDSLGNVVGVDLNRNYGYNWGYNDVGSSPQPESATFRGNAPFSEPETQAIQAFCNMHQFQVCLNYHTYGNLLIYPWGYNDEPTEESATFDAFADLMTAENDFTAGTSTETVGYIVNGNSDDWMYGETDSKPAIYAMTPEVGPFSYGFWPPASEIDRLNKSALRQNLVAAHILHNYAEIELQSAQRLMAQTGVCDFRFKKYGLQAGTIDVQLEAADASWVVADTSFSIDATHLQEEFFSITYQILDETAEQHTLKATLDNGLYTWTQTWHFDSFLETLTPLIADDASDAEVWVGDGDWAITPVDFVSPSFSWTDSPNGSYAANTENVLQLDTVIDLRNATHATAQFYARWSIERNYDYTQFLVSTDGVFFEPQCGDYTRLGNTFVEGPLYDGEQADWVLETVDLNAYLGEQIYVQFKMVSDAFVELDGFYFDDFVVNAVLDEDTSVKSSTAIASFVLAPNPFDNQLLATFTLERPVEDVSLTVTDALGRSVVHESRSRLFATRHEWQVYTDNWQSGIYFVNITTNQGDMWVKKIVKK